MFKDHWQYLNSFISCCKWKESELIITLEKFDNMNDVTEDGNDPGSRVKSSSPPPWHSISPSSHSQKLKLQTSDDITNEMMEDKINTVLLILVFMVWWQYYRVIFWSRLQVSSNFTNLIYTNHVIVDNWMIVVFLRSWSKDHPVSVTHCEEQFLF